MCGRYTITLPLEELAEALNVEVPDFDFVPRYNAAPSQPLPVVTDEAPGQLSLHRWGLVPFWAKDPKIGHKMINARSETAAEKPAFRQAFAKRRCIVPIDGFYEWKKTPHGKVPHHIHLKGGGVIRLAGLWESWRDAEEREIRTFTILTTEANQTVAELHDRMPVILDEKEAARWLDSGLPPDEAQEMMRPYAADKMEHHAVSTRVNNPRNEGPENLEADAEPGLFDDLTG